MSSPSVTPKDIPIEGGFLKRTVRWLDQNIERVLLQATLLAIIFLMTYQTLGRYVFVRVLDMNVNLAWTEELSRFLFVWMTYLAVPITIKDRNMIRVTALVDRLPKRWQNALWVTSDVLFFILGGGIFYFGVRHVNMLLHFPQTTAVLGLQYALVYMILPIGFGLILLRLGQDLLRMVNEEGYRPLIEGAVIAAILMFPTIIGLELPAAVWLFGYFIIFVAIGVSIAIALGLSAFITMFAAATLPINYIATQSFTSIDNVTIMAIPFFIAAGTFMGEGGLSQRLLNLADNLLGRSYGGFGMATVLTCMLFAAMSGSGPATVAAIGSLTIPAMIERGYDKHFSAALVAAAGSIGVMIPPSNPFVVYGVAANTSVGDLFMAGIVPGILVGVLLMLYTYFLAKKNGWHGDKSENTRKLILHSLWDAKWALLVPIIILGGIYSGLMTPTESAAVAAFYGLVVGVFLYKGLNKSNIGQCLVDSTNTSATIILLMAMASIFGNILTLEDIPATIAEAILGLSKNPIIILLFINILLLIVGMFMEALAAIVILTPILLPIVTQLGVDPVHFGVIMVVNLAIGFITPPVGVNLFVSSGVANLKLENIAKAVLPMLGLMIVLLLVITYIPSVVLWLPQFLN
ncbi:MAG: TRAP transporter large permease subunit [Peptococcaceae bacterium]